MDSNIPSTPLSPNSRSLTTNHSPHTTYTRHHRKRISALRLSSDTTSTLPEYIPTNPHTTSGTTWRTVPETTELDDEPPGYSSDSAQEADEDTDLSDEDRRRRIQRSVVVTVGINSAPATATAFNSSTSLRSSRHKREPSHRRKRSNPTLSLDPSRSASDFYLDSLLERSVHALEMSNALLQSSISTKTSLNGILNQETDEDESMVASSATPVSAPRSGVNSLERSALGLSSRIMRRRDAQETWIEDLEQIAKDVDELFSETAQKERTERNRRRRNDSGSGSSQGSISTSLPVISSAPLQTYDSYRDRTVLASGFSSQPQFKHARRKSSLDSHSISQAHSFSAPPKSQHPLRFDDMAGVPHLRYDVQDRERFISQPPRALTQYIVVEGDLRHGHEGENGYSSHDHQRSLPNIRSAVLGGENKIGRNVKNFQNSTLPGQNPDSKTEEEAIVLPSTLGLRSSGTQSTFRRNKLTNSRSRSPSFERSISHFVRRHPGPDQIIENSGTSSTSKIVLDSAPTQPTHSSQPVRAPNAYNMLSSFVYPTPTLSPASTSVIKRSNSSSTPSRPGTKTSPFSSPWTSRRSSAAAAERPTFGITNSSRYSKRRHSASPAASTKSNHTSRSGDSATSSTVTGGSRSRSRSQTPKPVGFGFSPTSGRRNMTPPLEMSSNSGSGSGGEGDSSERQRRGSEESSDSCPTKQTILSLRKILDTHNPPEKLSDEWTLISKPPVLLQQSLRVGIPAEAGTSTATASISKLYRKGVHSHQGSVTRQNSEQRHSSFKGKGKASATDSAASSVPPTPPLSPAPSLNLNKMSFDHIPKFLSNSVALALGASSPLSSAPSSGTSTPATPGHAKRISFAQLPEGTKGMGSERNSSKRRKGKQKVSSNNGNGSASHRDDDERDEPKGWLGWLINVAGVDTARPDKVDERLGKGWSSSASRISGYGGMDEWGI
ncbi:hypothetical protein EV361DRAFT_222222 [Lentinula raphanica]|nr:hypothetical protein EV361DRAFT_222222 [Lentinula raphanica]